MAITIEEITVWISPVEHDTEIWFRTHEHIGLLPLSTPVEKIADILVKRKMLNPTKRESFVNVLKEKLKEIKR